MIILLIDIINNSGIVNNGRISVPWLIVAVYIVVAHISARNESPVIGGNIDVDINIHPRPERRPSVIIR